MHTIIGAGQIALALTSRLVADGQEVTILRRRHNPVPGARVIAGDASNPDDVARALASATAVYHAMHASAYRSDTWRRELPGPEQVVMDRAAERGIPVIFPESVYAFGTHAEGLTDDPTPAPCSPLGEVRAELLAARAAHPAGTISVVASDLVGPTVRAAASIPTSIVIRPLLRGRSPWIFGTPRALHAITDLDDLAAAMIHAASHSERFAGRTLLAPTVRAHSMQQLADDVADVARVSRRRVRPVPAPLLTAAGIVHPTARSLAQMRYLWEQPVVLQPGVLTAELGEPAWTHVVENAVRGVRPS